MFSGMDYDDTCDSGTDLVVCSFCFVLRAFGSISSRYSGRKRCFYCLSAKVRADDDCPRTTTATTKAVPSGITITIIATTTPSECRNPLIFASWEMFLSD